jgi:SnoaL-like domain
LRRAEPPERTLCLSRPYRLVPETRPPLTVPAATARVLTVQEAVPAFIDEYIRRYSERDVEGVTELCLAPFLAIREGIPIHMPDREAVRDHFAAMIDAYRGGGVAVWKRVEIDVRELGEHAVFATVRWNALDAQGEVLRDTRTTYHLLATPDGWRFLSYTNHF